MHPDHHPYFRYTPKSRLDKAVKTLAGIIEGIAIDSVVNQKEFLYLREWVDQCNDVRNRHPFTELIPVVEEALSDGVLTDVEKEDILWLCAKLSAKGDFYKKATQDIQKLHGVLAGILSDGTITEEELRGLSEWLSEHDHLKTCWPYDEIDSLVTAVMSDGKTDEEEQATLQQLFTDFIQIEDDKTITNPLMLVEEQSLTGICAMCPEIEFRGSVFCFTGASSRYKRKDLVEVVEMYGGNFSKNLTKEVNYLVIGADGNPCWAYACYGRKVEQAIALRKQGHNIVLVHENDFHDAVADM